MLLEGIALVLACFLTLLYRYYYKPQAEIKRYRSLFQKLGYKVYEQPFLFLNFSFNADFEKGLKCSKDTRFIEKTLGAQVDVFVGNLIERPYLMIFNPDLIRAFLSNDLIMNYPKYQYMIKTTKEILGNGLVFSEGEEWKHKRKLLSKVFNYELIKAKFCSKAFDICQERGEKQGNKYSYLVCKVAAKMFSGVMMKCFFGYDNLNERIAGMSYDQFMLSTMSQASYLSQTPLVATLGTLAVKLGLTGKIRQVNRNISLMRQKALEIVKKRTEEVQALPIQQKPTDILQALLLQKNRQYKDKECFEYNSQQLIDEFHTFLVAGTDSTTRYFTMMTHYLFNNPKALAKLRQEIHRIIKTKDDINEQNLKKLVYTEMVQQETLRLYDVSNGLFIRIATKDNFVKDVPISKGTLVSTNPIGNHYSQKYFKEPFAFRPERWENQCNQLPPFAFLGFSSGPRNCLGKYLALLSSKIALVTFIKRYQSYEVPQEVTMTADIFYEAIPFVGTFIKQQRSQ